MSKLKYGIIGCGRISTNHIRAAVSNNLQIVAACDLLDHKIVETLSEHNLSNDKSIKHYKDYKKMLEENVIDLIAIATESGNHAEIALYCINKGIHVIIEKPMAMSIEEADKIISLSEKNKVKVSVCHQNRFNIAVQKTKKALDDRRFGKISHATVHIRWNRGHDYYSQSNWRGTWAQDGGTLMNQCIHGIDLLCWLINSDIVEVYGITKQQFHNFLEAEDVGVAIVQFKNGAVATIEGSTNVFPKNLEETLYIFGEKGTVKLGGKSTNNIDIWEFADEDENDAESKNFEEITSNVYGNGHTPLYTDMIKAIENNKKPYIDAHEGKQAMELVLGIYKSQKSKCVVKFPLDDFSTLDMVGEFK